MKDLLLKVLNLISSLVSSKKSVQIPSDKPIKEDKTILDETPKKSDEEIPTLPKGYSDKKPIIVALVVGHSKKDEGAVSVRGEGEYSFYRQVVALVQQRVKGSHVEVYEVLRDGTNIRGAIRRAKDHFPDYCIELHFNSFNSAANGAEWLYPVLKNPFAKEFNEKWCAEQKIRNRGLKCVKAKEHGFASTDEMRKLKMNGFLWEPFFGDNQTDYRRPEVVADFIAKYFLEKG